MCEGEIGMKWRGFPGRDGDELPKDDQARAIDFGRTAEDYDRHRPGFPDSFFERIFAEGLVARGQRALDLGTGTGTMALGLAARGMTVTALDRSPELFEVLARRAKAAGLPITIKQALAEDTEEPAASFEVVTAAQCWWWF